MKKLKSIFLMFTLISMATVSVACGKVNGSEKQSENNVENSANNVENSANNAENSVNNVENSVNNGEITYVGSSINVLPLKDVQENYSLEDAKKDACVVFEDLDITKGQDIWNEFVKKTNEGKPAIVRLAFYYTLDEKSCDPKLYEEEKNKYPVLYVEDLIYDGKKYTSHSFDEGKEYFSSYKYLVRCNDIPNSTDATYENAVKYILVDDDTVTWDEIFQGLISSQSGAGIRHKLVYNDYIWK